MRNSKGSDVVIPRTSDGVHPLFAVYSRKCLAAVEAALARNERRMRSFHSGLRVRELTIAEDNPTWKNVLININTPAELSQVLGKNTRLQSTILAPTPSS
jgi:molybdopterin-guanine dinucleotide biosynthesis protein A